MINNVRMFLLLILAGARYSTCPSYIIKRRTSGTKSLVSYLVTKARLPFAVQTPINKTMFSWRTRLICFTSSQNASETFSPSPSYVCNIMYVNEGKGTHCFRQRSFYISSRGHSTGAIFCTHIYANYMFLYVALTLTVQRSSFERFEHGFVMRFFFTKIQFLEVSKRSVPGWPRNKNPHDMVEL